VDQSAPLSILVICTANLCRSPVAEALMRAAAARNDLPWSVASAGTHARPGLPIHPAMADVLLQRQVDVTEFVSQRLSVDLLDRADIILTATAAHRTTSARMHPRSIGRTFLLLEFAELMEHRRHAGRDLSHESAPTVLAEVRRLQSSRQPSPVGAYDLADPIGQPPRHYKACVDAVTLAVTKIVGRDGPSPAG
jgi:protein-tyrosine phosphatase